MKIQRHVSVVMLLLLATASFGARVAESGARHHHRQRGTVDDLLRLDVTPFAVAHRGFGDNLGEDPARPIENTVRAVQAGFRAGASIVEVDVQLTRHGDVAVFHDDFLSDGTCLNRLTLSQLHHRLPFIPRLEAVLHEAREFNQAAGPLRGLVIVELKAAAPLCDPDDTQEHAIVAAVTHVIRRLHMSDQVMFTSLSPALLYIASQEAPEIARILSISGLQFLTAEDIEKRLGTPVTVIDKQLDLGLQWAEVGAEFRLPGYRSVGEVLATAGLVGAQAIEADLFLLSSAGAPFVDVVHSVGLKALGFTATTPGEWFFLQSLGLDGIYANDVPFGVAHQAAIP